MAPRIVVIGGGVGNIDALYTEETRQKIAAHIFNPTFEAALVKPTLGDSAGVTDHGRRSHRLDQPCHRQRPFA